MEGKQIVRCSEVEPTSSSGNNPGKFSQKHTVSMETEVKLLALSL